MSVQADLACEYLATGMSHIHCVLWLDNNAKLKYTDNPQHRNASLNATAVAVLQIPAFANFSGHITLTELPRRVPVRSEALARESRALHTKLIGMQDRQILRAQFRYPLDIIRMKAHMLQWIPMSILPWRVGDNLSSSPA